MRNETNKKKTRVASPPLPVVSAGKKREEGGLCLLCLVQSLV